MTLRFPCVFVAILSAFLLLCTPARAQSLSDSESDFASCRELSDPDGTLKLELCSSHLGCRIVAKVYKSCTAVRSFLDRLSASIGRGVKTLFGYRREVQADNLWDALQSDSSVPRLDDLPAEKARSATIRQALSTADLRPTEVRSANGNSVAFGNTKNGALQGWGMNVSADGTVTRGQFRDGKLEGPGERLTVVSNGLSVRMSGEFSSNQMQGEGAMATAAGMVAQGRFQAQVLVDGRLTAVDGSRQEGRFDPQSRLLIEGSKYSAAGSLVEKGTFRDGQLHVGDRYSEGQVVAQVNRPRELMQQAEALQATNADRARAKLAEQVAAEQRARDDAAMREQKFRSELAALNAGQLFALADELRDAGKADLARQALRALVSRFPDHPLASQAATSLAGASIKTPAATTPAPPDRIPTSGNSQAAARGALKGKSCDAERANAEGAYRQTYPRDDLKVMNISLASASISVPIDDEEQARRLFQQESQRRASQMNPFQVARSNYLSCLLERAYGDLSGPAPAAAGPRPIDPDNPNNGSITGIAAAYSGASRGDVCNGEPLRNPYFEAAIQRLKEVNSASASLRGSMVGIEIMLISLRKCPPNARVQSQIAQYEQQRDKSLTACRQIVARDNCTQSPF